MPETVSLSWINNSPELIQHKFTQDIFVVVGFVPVLYEHAENANTILDHFLRILLCDACNPLLFLSVHKQHTDDFTGVCVTLAFL